MPIAKRPSDSRAVSNLSPPGVLVPSGVSWAAGTAVALENDAGSSRYVLCGAGYYATCFYGFLYKDAVAGSTATVTTGRGSILIPLVEHDAALIADRLVFLSATPGRVTQTAPIEQGLAVLKVGMALDATQMVLNTDPFVYVG